uniref:hypothetical protein n=1 Tax=Enterocloster clostridioformis TaxID=1531 RepID=UPI0025A558CC|nr:hypothetical protein [Enterocloster clostridioformis]
MNITDMILVTENHKGNETNSLMDLLDFIDFAVKESWLSLKELAEDMATLGMTCREKEKWMESCFAENTTLSARYCADEKQLEAFLRGGYNTDQEWKFDEQKCSENCLACLKALGISMDKRSEQEYGTTGQMKELDEHHSRLRNKFNLFYTLSKNVFATDSIKSEAVKAMYEEFGTGRQEVFLKNLEGGKYDPGFAHEQKQQRVR